MRNCCNTELLFIYFIKQDPEFSTNSAACVYGYFVITTTILLFQSPRSRKELKTTMTSAEY